MMVRIEKALDEEQLRGLRAHIDEGDWVDGNAEAALRVETPDFAHTVSSVDWATTLIGGSPASGISCRLCFRSARCHARDASSSSHFFDRVI